MPAASSQSADGTLYPASRPAAKTVLVLTPTFVPDPAAVGQHMAEMAVEMARRGHRVLVYTANRGYDNPADHYPAWEDYHGVSVRRLPLSSFGKANFLTRALGTLSFAVQCFFRVLLKPRVAGIVITTSPPFSDLAGAIAGWIRRRPVVYWAMDLYAEQVVALGRMERGSRAARILQLIQRFILRRSTKVIALDRFMAQLLDSRVPVADRTLVIAPWPLESHIAAVPHEANPFREAHGLQGKFVVMYSGNHTPTNPLTTLLEAAVRLKDDPDIRFVFVGGGRGKQEVQDTIARHSLTNALSLPYQPLAQLGNSLSAADVHVVSLGQRLVGICHPCKVYGAMAVGRPLLYLGPRPSHVSDLLDAGEIGWHVDHGDVDGMVAAIRAARQMPEGRREEMGRRARMILQQRLSQEALRGQLCDELERTMGLSGRTVDG